MVNKKKVRDIRRPKKLRKPKRVRKPAKLKKPEKSPDWENLFDMEMKKEVRDEARETGLKAWPKFQKKGQYKDFVLKFMESRPKITTGKVGRITEHGNKVKNHSFVKNAEKHHQFAIEEVARVLQSEKYGIKKGKTGRYYAKGHRGALKKEFALDLLTEFSELME